MGRLSEAMRYLKVKPERLTEFNQKAVYQNYKDNEPMKKLRSKIKLYKE